ncbi:uncharacterized protein LOC124811489 isoform X3 [Hydra vulgaris]|uniref:Uncharacterized protein LOC124811489 isoform X3 n=1 Tax=Hydra vulgaris TaxID=6087 RepID=A0ABM4CL45_HYDVU
MFQEEVKEKWENLYLRQYEQKVSFQNLTLLEGLLFAQLKISITPTMINGEDSISDQPVLNNFSFTTNMTVNRIIEHNTKLVINDFTHKYDKIDITYGNNIYEEKKVDESDDELYATIPFTFKANSTNCLIDQWSSQSLSSRLKKAFSFNGNRADVAPKIPPPRKASDQPIKNRVSIPEVKLNAHKENGYTFRGTLSNLKRSCSKLLISSTSNNKTKTNNQTRLSSKNTLKYNNETVNKLFTEKYLKKIETKSSIKTRRISQTTVRKSNSNNKQRNSYSSSVKKSTSSCSSFLNQKKNNTRCKSLKTKNKYHASISLKLTKRSYQILTSHSDLSTDNSVMSLNYCQTDSEYRERSINHQLKEKFKKSVLPSNIDKETTTLNKKTTAEEKCCDVQFSQNPSNIYLKPIYCELLSTTNDPNFARNIKGKKTLLQMAIDSNLYKQEEVKLETIAFDIHQPLPTIPII